MSKTREIRLPSQPELFWLVLLKTYDLLSNEKVHMQTTGGKSYDSLVEEQMRIFTLSASFPGMYQLAYTSLTLLPLSIGNSWPYFLSPVLKDTFISEGQILSLFPAEAPPWVKWQSVIQSMIICFSPTRYRGKQDWMNSCLQGTHTLNQRVSLFLKNVYV